MKQRKREVEFKDIKKIRHNLLGHFFTDIYEQMLASTWSIS